MSKFDKVIMTVMVGIGIYSLIAITNALVVFNNIKF